GAFDIDWRVVDEDRRCRIETEGAKAYGWNEVLFSGPEKLRSDLAAYGLKV
ncbi:HAD family phosphatase, partial [Rhizobium ruizarguesonis]